MVTGRALLAKRGDESQFQTTIGQNNVFNRLGPVQLDFGTKVTNRIVLQRQSDLFLERFERNRITCSKYHFFTLYLVDIPLVFGYAGKIIITQPWIFFVYNFFVFIPRNRTPAHS